MFAQSNKLAGLIAVFILSSLTVSLVVFAHDDGQKPRSPLEKLPDLVSGLKSVEGCLGVEAARTQSGKNVIFAWFKDKEAVLNWYHHPMHQGVMKTFFPDHTPREPLAGIPDDLGPIMAIASITFTDKGKFPETTLPVSQISIELYTPISGGLFLGSKFSPDAVKVSNMLDFTPEGGK